MKFYVGNEIFDYSDEELFERLIGEGVESMVYYFNGKACKIHREKHYIGSKTYISEETAKYLSKIETNRFLLPQDIIKNEEGKYIGYSSKYLMSYSPENYRRMTMEKFISELRLLKEDVIKLSSKKVYIEDLWINNSILNDGIYIIDPGSYRVDLDDPFEFVEEENRRRLNDFIVREILLNYSRISKKNGNIVNSHFPYSKYIDEIMENEINPKETIPHYVKSLIKK